MQHWVNAELFCVTVLVIFSLKECMLLFCMFLATLTVIYNTFISSFKMQCQVHLDLNTLYIHTYFLAEFSLPVQEESTFQHLQRQSKSLKLYVGLAKKEAPGAVVHRVVQNTKTLLQHFLYLSNRDQCVGGVQCPNCA